MKYFQQKSLNLFTKNNLKKKIQHQAYIRNLLKSIQKHGLELKKKLRPVFFSKRSLKIVS